MSKKLIATFVKSLKQVGKTTRKSPSEVTKSEFFANDEQGISEWDVRKLGGFATLQKMYFPKETNLEVEFGSKLISNHRKGLEKKYGAALYFEKELKQAVTEHLKANPIILHKPTNFKKSSKATSRTLVAAISDTHFGSNISKEEMQGLNEYSWTIASRRLALFAEQIVNYKKDKRNETDLVVQLNGDIIAGLIHNTEGFAQLLATQFSGSISILSQAISYFAQHFQKVTVVCTSGNHGRNMAKIDKGRATTNKWDSYETMIYVSLKEILTGKHKNVTFSIPEAPFAMYKVQGHTIFQTHGDTVINVGNPGNSINMSSISNQLNKLSTSDLLKNADKIAILSVGHVHVPTVQLLDNGGVAIINGCLSGTDPFAQSIGIFSNNPTQLLFEATKEHAVGDVRMIQVKSADSIERLDKIIRPFKDKF